MGGREGRWWAESMETAEGKENVCLCVLFKFVCVFVCVCGGGGSVWLGILMDMLMRRCF